MLEGPRVVQLRGARAAGSGSASAVAVGRAEEVAMSVRAAARYLERRCMLNGTAMSDFEYLGQQSTASDSYVSGRRNVSRQLAKKKPRTEAQKWANVVLFYDLHNRMGLIPSHRNNEDARPLNGTKTRTSRGSANDRNHVRITQIPPGEYESLEGYHSPQVVRMQDPLLSTLGISHPMRNDAKILLRALRVEVVMRTSYTRICQR